MSNFSTICPPPPDLTSYISKDDSRYCGGGAFGDVYKCRYADGSAEKEVAVKAIRFNVIINDKHVKMLRRELGIWKRLDHTNIVPFLGIAYGFGMEGTMSLVSLWMPNNSLHAFLAKHDDELGLVHRIQFLLDIANGLHYLHSRSIIHGDLKSDNVLLDADYTARLTDFGFASMVGNIPEALIYLQASTRGGAVRWSAPEQIEAETGSGRATESDIYAFGGICLQVLSGKQPWSEVHKDTAVILYLARGEKPGRPASRRMDDLHWDFIQRCWSAMEERPVAEEIIFTMQQFLSYCPLSLPLRDVLTSPSSRAGSPVHESSSSSFVDADGNVLGGDSGGTQSLGNGQVSSATTNPSVSTQVMVPLPADAQDHPSPPTSQKLAPVAEKPPAIVRVEDPETNDVNRTVTMRIKQNRPSPVPPPLPNTYQATERPPVLVDVKDLRPDDVVIAVMGPSESGKSTFIGCATGYGTVGVGHTLKSCTQEVRSIRFWHQESRRNVVLVDTPGFDNAYRSDLDILKLISEWLRSSYNKHKLLSGILYLHRITDNRMTGTPLKNLRLFNKLCGTDALSRVYLTTTMWDEVEPSTGQMRLEELTKNYWKTMINWGAKVACYYGDANSAKDVIRRILIQENPHEIARLGSDGESSKELTQLILAREGACELRLQTEMIRLQMELKETAAGQQLFADLETLVQKQTELLRRIAKERTVASDSGVAADLQAEYDALRGQLNDKLHQMEELKLPRLWRLRRLLSWGRH